MNDIKNIFKKSIRKIVSLFVPVTVAHITELAPNELLKGRTALITGGTGGIGFAIAEAFLKAGASVIVTSRNVNNAKKQL